MFEDQVIDNVGKHHVHNILKVKLYVTRYTSRKKEYLYAHTITLVQ